MDDIYLNPELKEYYKNDFIENVLKVEDSFWGVPVGIVDMLKQLNDSENIQPLYSCYPDNPSKKNGYLLFAYNHEVENVINTTVIPELTQSLKEIKHGKFTSVLSKPRSNENYRGGKSKYKMGCIDNPDYFLINHYEFNFEADGRHSQNIFWNEMTRLLLAL